MFALLCVYFFIACIWTINLAAVRTPAAVYHGKRDATLARRKEAKKTGHYRQEGIIIELSESGAAAFEVSIDSEGLTVLLLLITHRGSYVFGRFL